MLFPIIRQQLWLLIVLQLIWLPSACSNGTIQNEIADSMGRETTADTLATDGSFQTDLSTDSAHSDGKNISDMLNDSASDQWDKPDSPSADIPDSDSFDSDSTDIIGDSNCVDMSSPELFADLLDADSSDFNSPPDTNDAVTEPPPLYDLPMIVDPLTADCTFDNHSTVLKDGVLVDLWNVSYLSWESIDGQLQPILIKGFAARPAGLNNDIPGVVQAHGLGGFAKPEHATGTAALLGMFVLAYTGPGGGDEPDNTSEGLPASDDNGYRMFDVLTDLRGSWFWGHSVAAMRAVTCLETHPDVDPDRLGITGFSAGGVMSTIVAGRDPRVKAAVPLSGTLAWGAAVPSPNAWQHMLLTQAGLTVSSPEWGELLNLVDPTATLSMTNTSIFMVNGTSDEFFPLTAHLATYEAIPAGNKRTSFAANFDHGCYQLTGGESAQTIEDRAEIRGAGGQRMWFRHFFGTDPNYSYVPEPPVMEMAPLGLATAVTAVVDPGGSKLDVEHVKVWWSNDDAFLFGSVELSEQGGGIYGEMALFPTVAKTVAFVDVQYKVKGWLNNERFSISSAPILPEGFVPHIRHWETCL